ncbi:T9SS type A sorting domain-containing protein, partial [Winogradskyella psychrotolerans]|uniref:T9SS type A sorting domain-containing protein n=1 Tax=Winogradskyella psychrotolerans TaxID=1344585 RepID=UPI001C0655CF
YTWNTGETSASITVNPTQTTTYTVTVTDSFGNSDTDSVIVIVNDLPIISVSENITIVEGESTSLSVNGAETYVWNTGETSNTIIVSPTVTTTYNVIGITNSCTSELKEVTVAVSPLFRASAGSDTRVCDNQSYEVILTANEGDSYLWSTGETTQSIVVSPLSTANYSVTVTLGEQTDTDDVMVFVDPSPDVVIANGDSVDILSGDFVTLSASGANTYQWDNGATQPNIAVSPSITTTYEVKGYIGDCYDDKQVTVNVLQPVVADAGEDVLICIDDNTTLTASGGDDYVWSTGETTPTITVSPTETTDYTVTVFNSLDFDEATVRVEVDLDCAIDSIQPIDEDEVELNFDVYPNPASDFVNVKITGTLNVSDINIYDVTGKLVKHSKITNENFSYTTTTQIGIRSLQSGVYFVKLIDKNRAITKKLLIN